jgi:signal transduction histidine kinase
VNRGRLTAWLSRARPVTVLVLSGVAAVAVIGVVLMLILRHAGIEHERGEAELSAEVAGNAVVAPLITEGVLRGDPAALAKLDRAVQLHVLLGPVQRVKLWAADGRIVYSDERRLIGESFVLAPDELEALASGGVTSDLSEHSRPENRFETGEEPLLEVYTRVRALNGEPMLFEVYHDFESIVASGRSLFVVVLPALVGGLVLLALTNLVAARWFARYVLRRDEQRAGLLANALDASSRERRRIVADLHDGVVQDLTAASMAVSNAARPLSDGVIEATTVPTLEEAAETVRRSVGTLRTLLMDFYPADLEARGLPAALGDLVELAATRGVEAELDVSPGFSAPAPTAALLYRIAQEALRNATAHAHARRVSVSVGVDRARYWLEVVDDGEGFDAEAAARDGHVGLRSVHDLLGDAGGWLSVRSTPTAGTVVRAELPDGLQ